jgi:hypothetical protein
MSTPAVTPTHGRRAPLRWAIALVATVALIVSGSGLVVFAQSGAGESQGPVFVPADAAIYLEARLDMPAGQGEALAQMLTAFPGFADTGSFDLKVDELLSGLAAEMGLERTEADLVGDVLTGEMGLAIGDLGVAMMGADDPAMLVGLAVADPALAAMLLESMAGDAGEEMYGGTTILSDLSTSAAIHDGWMLLSNDVAQVKTAIDVLDGTVDSLADDPGFSTSFARVPSGHLGAAYVDLQSFGSLIDLAGMMATGETGLDLPVDDLSAMLPQDMVMFLAAEADRLNLEVLVTAGESTPSLPLGESELAGLFPADTQLYLEAREVGASVKAALDALVGTLAAQEGGGVLGDDSMGDMGGLGDLSDIEALFGEESPITGLLGGVPLPEYLDFVADASVGAGLSSDGLWLGMAGEVTDQAVATDRVSTITSLVRLFGGDPAQTGISVESEMVGDVEVTSIMLPLDEMLAESGLPISVGDSISVAVSDGYLLLGLGDFVQSALAGDAAGSLGASAGYLDAVGEDTANTGLMYMNVSALLAALDPMLSMMLPEWADIAPYATGVDRIILVGTADDAVMRARMTMIVNQ